MHVNKNANNLMHIKLRKECLNEIAISQVYV